MTEGHPVLICPLTATRGHNGSRSSLLKTHLTPKSSLASNRGLGPVRQMCAIHQAKKFREFGINENLGQGNVVSGAMLHDGTNDGRRFINPVVHQRDGNWSRARRDHPIDRFDEFRSAGHVQFFAPVGFEGGIARQKNDPSRIGPTPRPFPVMKLTVCLRAR
jgi:hypothetical protein